MYTAYHNDMGTLGRRQRRVINAIADLGHLDTELFKHTLFNTMIKIMSYRHLKILNEL